MADVTGLIGYKVDKKRVSNALNTKKLSEFFKQIRCYRVFNDNIFSNSAY